ncbi:hypothetical protein EV360DRAFT_86297 [Lentinula raphanica]|nr:hypothetical protein EV360DRAFT_86297 [Lentinula raphanica]
MSSNDPEWAYSVENFLGIRKLYASSVIKYLRDSESSSSVFAWPKENYQWDADATIAQGLHNEMNNTHFGFEDDSMQHCFGDSLAEHLEFILHTTSSFPGEPVDDEEITSPDCFVAVRVSATYHVLLDSAYDGRRGNGSLYNAALSGTLNLPMQYKNLAALTSVVRKEVLAG